MKEELQRIRKEFERSLGVLQNLKPADALKKIQELKIEFSSKKSPLMNVLKQIGSLVETERREVGAAANELKKHVEAELTQVFEKYSKVIRSEELKTKTIDYTLSGRYTPTGHLHPLTHAQREITSALTALGFEVVDSPELEDDFHNFEAVNIPKNHPARDMQDTLYVSENLLLRSHTSNAQIRVMEKRKPPLRIICPGRVYRSDYDPTHSPMFTQIEGLIVDRYVSFSELKGTIAFFIRKLFGEKIGFRFRASYFPFTEPSAEVDMECIFCRGKGCSICKKSGWLEILGCGMVNPKVFEAVGYDPNITMGFAFGVGIERVAMLKYGINDMRVLFANDIRTLKQF